ncbi:MAG: hypothetical protein K1X42_08800 [Opitutaceae bacterium]|nr:hypothetical protein [Opitutaceae bacterium]
MSLINEALKKAQKQRAHEPLTGSPISSSAPPPPRVAKRKEPMPAQTLVIIGTLCLVLIAALGAGAWYIFKESSTQIAATNSRSHQAANGAGVSSAPAASDATVSTVILPQTLPQTTATTAVAPSPMQVPAVSNPPPVSSSGAAAASPSIVASATQALPAASGAQAPADPHPSQTAAVAAVPAAAAAPIEVIQITSADLKRSIPPNPQALAVVDTFKVSGIRASASDPKVLLNDRVFRLNDIVERTYGLRLTEVHADRLLFIDDAGAVYTKTF